MIQTPSDRSGPPTDSRYLRSVKTSAWLNLGRLARVAKDAGVQVESRMQFSVPDACIVQHAKPAHIEIILMGSEVRVG